MKQTTGIENAECRFPAQELLFPMPGKHGLKFTGALKFDPSRVEEKGDSGPRGAV